MEIHNAGGGIGFTVDHTRRATSEELFTSFQTRMSQLLRSGIRSVILTTALSCFYDILTVMTKLVG